MRRLLTHEEAQAKYGPTRAYLSATQPRWVTVVKRFGEILLILGGVTVVIAVPYTLWSDGAHPHKLLLTFAATTLGAGALALLPMLIYQAVKGLPVVQDKYFVPLTIPHILLVAFIYLVIFGVCLPLVIQDVFGATVPDWFKELARSSASIMAVLKLIF